MFTSSVSRRIALLGAFLAIAIGLAVSAGATSTHAQPAFESEKQSVVANSRVRLVLVGGPDSVAWNGKIHFPDGSEPSWQSLGLVPGTSFTVLENLQQGTYVVNPGIMPAGYEFKGIEHHFNANPNQACSSDKAQPVLVFGISANAPQWTVCIHVRSTSAIPGSQLTLQAVGLNHFPQQLSGGVSSTHNVSWSWSSLGLGAGERGTLKDIPAGDYVVMALKPVGSAGLEVKGYASVAHPNPAVPPSCPPPGPAYTSFSAVNISAAQPRMASCIWFERPGKLSVSIRAVHGGLDNPWLGEVDGPSPFDFTFAEMGISGPNYSGAKINLSFGNYDVIPAAPIRPGWLVKGYAEFPTDNLFPPCPTDFASYSADGEVKLTSQEPHWAVCVWAEKSTGGGNNNPLLDTPGLPVIPVPQFIPNFDPPLYLPPTEQQPKPTPASTGGNSGAGPASPAASATPAWEVPSQTTVSSEAPQPQATPIAPSTGTSSADNGGAHAQVALLLGALLFAASALTMAAYRLPGRLKR